MEDLRDFEDDDDDDEDDLFDEDMEALRRACMISGTNPDRLSPVSADQNLGLAGRDDDDDDYDLELVQNIRTRFSAASPHLLKPLCTLPPPSSLAGDDEDDEDFETLRAIQRRFAAYGNDALKNGPDNSFEKQEKVQALASSISFEKKTPNDLYIHRIDASNELLDSEHASRVPYELVDDLEQPSASIEKNPTDSSKSSALQPNYSNFPKSAKVFMDSIKKNRSFQKFLRSKLIHIEAKIEENKKLKERVKILKEFQVSCRKRTCRALSQKKDTRVQLISMRKPWPSKDLKVHDKKIPAMYCGPVENSHVANYRMALEKYPISMDRKKWSDTERKNLDKGLRQQFQEMVLQNMVDRLSDSVDSHEAFNELDNVLLSIKDLNITPENIKEFMPKVNWGQLASLFVVGRSGIECETRWLNIEDHLINHNPWTAEEDKSLLFFVQNNGISNWFEISVSLGTNRTPFQCLARYQRSLNVSILKREWMKDDDAKLRNAVEVFGECNWQAVASSLEGWTGTQCSNRWKKTLHPAREKVGRWTEDEDKRLTVAQMLFGPKNWKKTAQYVPGRTEVQCRERWVNSLDPSLNWEKWTAEEDSKLREAIAEHGYCWAKVASALPRRTDNMCRRRWKRLLPHEVPLLQAARKMQKAALICNFVDRESERPAIGLNDFCPIATITANEDVQQSKPTKRRRRPKSKETEIKSGCETVKKRRPKKSKKHTQTGSEEALVITNHGELLDSNQVSENGTVLLEGHKMQLRSENGEVLPGLDGKRKKRPRKPRSSKKELAEPGKEGECLEFQTDSSGKIDPLVESNTTLTKKKRVYSKRKNSKKATGSEENQNINVLDGKSLMTGPTTETEVAGCVDPTQAMETIGEEIGLRGGNDGMGSERNANVKRCRRRKRSGELVGVLQDVAPVPLEVNGVKKVERSRLSCTVLRLGESGDETPLSCIISNKLKKRKLSVDNGENDQNCTPYVIQHEPVVFSVQADMLEKQVPASNEVLRQDDGGTSEVIKEMASIDMESCQKTNSVSQASVVKKKLGKKGQNSKSCPRGSQLLSERVTQVHDGNDSSLVTNEPGVLLAEGTPVGTVKEPNEDNNEVDDDMSLACFLLSKSKKRRRQGPKK